MDDAARPGNAHIVPTISDIRLRLLAEHCGLGVDDAARLLAQCGSMIAMIESSPQDGKRLAPFVLRPLTDAEKAIADSGILDPERPDQLFEPMGKRGLFRRGGALRRPR